MRCVSPSVEQRLGAEEQPLSLGGRAGECGQMREGGEGEGGGQGRRRREAGCKGSAVTG